jgi:predicted lipoprotein with Yx(FWY)xxD motif
MFSIMMQLLYQYVVSGLFMGGCDMPTGLRHSKARLGTTRLFSFIVAVSLIAAILLPLSMSHEVRAWSTEPTVNTPICTAVSDQAYPNIVGDGSGGAIIAWMDHRSGHYDVFVQRLNASGRPLWTVDGMAICTAASDQAYPNMVGDGSGGAIIAWQDYRNGNYDIYAQRVDSGGSIQWDTNGVAICTYASDQGFPEVVSDGSGGAIVAWQDYRSGNYDIYAQRVDSGGAIQWATNGVAICTAASDQAHPELVNDGSAGAILAWMDYRSSNHDIYAQRVLASGTPLWAVNGVVIGTAFGDEEGPLLVADGLGGAFIAWTYSSQVWAQRVNSLGTPQWADNGLAVCKAFGDRQLTGMDGDGSGGLFMTWQDGRRDSGWPLLGNYDINYDIYAQRLNQSGVPQWANDGLAIYAGADDQVLPNIVADGCGGAIVAWMSYRTHDYDIYAQRVDSSGTPQWAGTGLAVCNAEGDQIGPPMIGDGCGGAILAWMDYRSTSNYDIYAQRVNALGALNTSPNQPTSASPSAGGTNVSVTPTLESSPFSDPDSGDTHSASQWRITATAADYSSPVFDSGADSANLLKISVPAGKLIGNTTYYWQVRHCDGRQDWSAWSAETSFTTQNIIPNQPASVSPASGTLGIKLKALLESSAFFDPDAADAHSASQWRITATAGDYSSPVFDSGTDNVSLLLLAIPPGKLKSHTTYYWQVRHQDNHGDWSEWSVESSFTTRKNPQTWIWIAAGAGAAAVLAGAIVTWLVLHRKKRVASQG